MAGRDSGQMDWGKCGNQAQEEEHILRKEDQIHWDTQNPKDSWVEGV